MKNHLTRYPRLRVFTVIAIGATLLLLTPGIGVRAGNLPLEFPYLVLPLELKNYKNGLCIDVAGADTSNGALIQQYTCNSGKNQIWFLAHAKDAFQFRAGHVGGMNMTVSDYSLAAGADIVIENPRMVYAQVWKVSQNTDSTFEIRGYDSDKCLDVDGDNSGAQVVQNNCNGGKSQKWSMTHREWAPSLIAKHSGKCVDVAGASKADNANVQQYECFDQDNQQWFIHPADKKGTYWYLVSANAGKCLDVADASTQNGANVQQYACKQQDNQKWQIVSQGNDYFSLKNKKSSKCLDVAGEGIPNNTNIQQYQCTGRDNQLFRWAFFQERHVQLVQLAEDNGSNRSTIPTMDMQTMVEYTNELYRPHGLRLLFDPATDVANLNSSGLRMLGQGGNIKCPDTNQTTDMDICAQRYAKSQWPEKIVVYVRPGGGTSSGDSHLIVLGEYRYNMVCSLGSDPGVPDKFWLAHELGHYLGLMHNQVTLDFYTGYTEASGILRNANDDIQVFDADFLPDTPPGVQWSTCASVHYPVFTMTLDGKNGPVSFPVDNNNVESYYYSESRKITGDQSKLIRGTMFSRWGGEEEF